MARLPLIATVLVLALAGSGCGGDDDSDGTASDPAGGSSSSSAPATATATATGEPSDDGGLTVTDGVTPEDLLSCLTGAGLDAQLSDSTPMGVDVPVAEIELQGMADYSGGTDQGGYLYVFADPETAAAQAGVVTLGGSDDPDNSRFAIHQNVVRALSIIVSEAAPSPDEQALFGCLPRATQREG